MKRKQRERRGSITLCCVGVGAIVLATALGVLAYQEQGPGTKQNSTDVARVPAESLLADDGYPAMEKAKWDYIISQVVRLKTIEKVDGYLSRKGSPLAGTGAKWLECSERYGIPYSLAIGIMGWESAMGRQCFRPMNAGGLMQYSGFGSWQDYIEAQYGFLAQHFGQPRVAEDCPGYCEGTPQSWLNGVNGIRREVESL
jgi:hypothetical protein